MSEGAGDGGTGDGAKGDDPAPASPASPTDEKQKQKTQDEPANTEGKLAGAAGEQPVQATKPAVDKKPDDKKPNDKKPDDKPVDKKADDKKPVDKKPVDKTADDKKPVAKKPVDKTADDKKTKPEPEAAPAASKAGGPVALDWRLFVVAGMLVAGIGARLLKLPSLLAYLLIGLGVAGLLMAVLFRDSKPDVSKFDPSKPPPPPRWWRTLRSDPPTHVRILLGIAFTSLLLLVWWFVTRGGDFMVFEFNGRTKLVTVTFYPSIDRIVPYIKFPGPGEVFSALPSLFDSDGGQFFFKHLMYTLERVVIGVGLAAIVGVSLGIMAASHRGVNAAVAPLVIFLRSVPMGPLLPMTLMLFGGLGEPQQRGFIFLALVGFVFADTVKAMSIVPERYVETAQTLGASRLQIIYKVLVPLAIPDIITSLRFQLGLGLGYITLAEFGAEWGIGRLLNNSERLADSKTVYSVLILMACVALVIDLLLRTIQRGMFAWRKDL